MKSLQEVSLSELRARRPDLVHLIESKARQKAAQRSGEHTVQKSSEAKQQEMEEAFARHAERGRALITATASEDDAEEAHVGGPASQGEAKRIELVEGYLGMGLSKKEAGLAAEMELAFDRFAPENRRRPAKLRQPGSNSGSAKQKMEEAFRRVTEEALQRFGITRHDDGTTF